MDTTGERSISGRALVVGALVIVLIITAAAVIFGPALRDAVRQEQHPRTLREPIAAGQHDGQVWEAVGHFDGTANCVELRFRGDVLDRACDTGTADVAATALPDGGPTVAYGIAAEDAAQQQVELDSGEVITTPVVAGDLGFPVGFWAVKLPEGAALAEP